MAKFTKYNNPNRKRRTNNINRHKEMDYTERCIQVTKNMLIDQKLGYEIPVSYYEDKVNVEGK